MARRKNHMYASGTGIYDRKTGKRRGTVSKTRGNPAKRTRYRGHLIVRKAERTGPSSWSSVGHHFDVYYQNALVHQADTLTAAKDWIDRHGARGNPENRYFVSAGSEREAAAWLGDAIRAGKRMAKRQGVRSFSVESTAFDGTRIYSSGGAYLGKEGGFRLFGNPAAGGWIRAKAVQVIRDGRGRAVKLRIRT